jgi:hypothetical protein
MRVSRHGHRFNGWVAKLDGNTVEGSFYIGLGPNGAQRRTGRRTTGYLPGLGVRVSDTAVLLNAHRGCVIGIRSVLELLLKA